MRTVTLLLACATACACAGDGKDDGDGTAPTDPVETTPTYETTTTPAPEEVCNDLDDDGDGEVDEGLDCTPSCAVDLPTGGPVPITPICTGTVDVPGYGPDFPASVGHLTDDNGDGLIGAGDVPELLVTNTGFAPFEVVQADGARRFTLTNGTMPGMAMLVDADGDGESEVYAIDRPALADDSREIERWAADGTKVWTSPRLFNGGDLFYEGAGVPTAADLDGDGTAELVFGEWILDAATGDLIRQLRGFEFDERPNESPATFGPVVADLDGDGLAEILFGGWVYGAEDTPLWTAPLDYQFPNWTFPAAVELDGDAELEVVMVNGGTVSAYEHDGTPLWDVAPDLGGSEGEPCVADFDGDGQIEIGAPLGGGVVVLEVDGSVLWNVPLYGAGGCSAVDLDGDGAAELLIQDYGGFRILAGPTGDELFRDADVYGLSNSLPAVVDYDGDGKAEILASSAGWSYGPYNGYRVYDSPLWPGVGATWSMSDFSEVRLSPSGAVTTGPAGLLRSRVPTSPARPGPSPVLRVELHDVCADGCDPDAGLVRLSVVVSNVGEVQAEAGLSLEVVSRTPAGEDVLATVPLPEIPPGTALDAIQVDVAPVVGPGQLSVRVSGEDQCLIARIVDEPCF